ncbi:DNA adenine methylase [Paenibacillus sp. YYML68]|uniref:DNA adenine methylase n=1 Tax=Paenibacillus sp. YYML68 TaxID=2909250 RepID=UPI002491D420|nr:DNA adenine methylase [Paenibacillus sp. YYML68]
MYQYSPLRYPGGKSKLSKYVKAVIESNGLLDGHYIEPYAGGAGVAFCLLMHEYVSTITINDLNRSINAFWNSVLNETDELCRMISEFKVDVEHWDEQRYIQNNPHEFSVLELGFSTFIMNRCNRSGIIKGGIIGGREQTGEWKIDARFNREALIKRIERIALYRNRIRLYNLDAETFIRDVIPRSPHNTLVYLDPPYYNKGQELYENHYKPEDHYNVYQAVVENIRQKWIITYDNVSQIKNMYGDFRQKEYSLSYSAANRYKGSEVMIYSNNTVIPNAVLGKVELDTEAL